MNPAPFISHGNAWRVRIAVTAVATILAAGCSGETDPVVNLSDFAIDLRFETLPDHQPIGGVHRWKSNQGSLAEFSFTIPKSRPETYQGRNVIEPEWWPVTLVLFPSGSDRSDNEANWLGLTRYSKPHFVPKPQRIIPLRHNRVGWERAGFPGNPPTPKYVDENPDKIYCWTFLAIKPELTGEFDYEVLAYPTQTGTIYNPELGELVVLLQGRFIVDPVSE